MDKRVCVLGMFVADLSFTTDRLPRSGETLLTDQLVIGPGGKGSNQAVAAAKMDVPVTFLTHVGNDPFGLMLKDLMAQHGIDGSGVVYQPDQATGAASIMVDRVSGQNAIIVSPGPAANISPDDVKAWKDSFKNSDIFVGQLESNKAATFAALKFAKSLGLYTILNPAPASDLPSDVYQNCDLITPNEIEAGQLLGQTIETVEQAKEATTALLDLGAGNVIITMGDQGLVLNQGDGPIHIPAAPTANPVIDTSGAGDCFTGCLAAALAKDLPLREAAEFANRAAAISVTRNGTAESMPSKSDCIPF